MKVLVVGAGSIGRRHLWNLRRFGIEGLGVVESDASRRKAIASEFDLTVFEELTAGLKWAPNFVIVATPTHLHLEQAMEIARADLPLFVEKPLTHAQKNLDELVDIVRDKKLSSLVGCNMRFHPGPAQVKRLLDGGSLGKILFARIHAGSYLPEWRPNVDYRQNYAARGDTGGGCILDCIHEIDLARWYLGDIESVFCRAGHLSSLEIETEDVAVLICQHRGGAVSEIHLDYVQRTYERGCQIVGELGSVFWDFNSKAVRCYQATSKEWTTYPQPDGWELNDMYVDEMQHFLDCLGAGSLTMLPIPEAAALMQIVFAAKVSSQQGKMIAVEREPSR